MEVLDEKTIDALKPYSMVGRSALLQVIGISAPTLLKWRAMGLPHIRLGRAIRYNILQVLEWMQSNDRPRKSRKGTPNKNRSARSKNNQVAKG